MANLPKLALGFGQGLLLSAVLLYREELEADLTAAWQGAINTPWDAKVAQLTDAILAGTKKILDKIDQLPNRSLVQKILWFLPKWIKSKILWGKYQALLAKRYQIVAWLQTLDDQAGAAISAAAVGRFVQALGG